MAELTAAPGEGGSSPLPPAFKHEHERCIIALLPRLAAGVLQVVLSETGAATPVDGEGTVPELEHAPCHAHPVYEICWLLEGRCVLWFSGEEVTLDSGHACIVRPGEVHQLRPTPQLEPFRSVWWQFTPEGMMFYYDIFADRRHRAREGFVPLATSAVPLLEAALRELTERRPHYELFVRTALLEVAARTLRRLAERPKAQASAPPPRANLHVERLLQHVQTHHGPEQTLESLAATVGLSPKYLANLFHRQTGRTVIAYVNEMRHREAQSLLRTTNLDIAAVARAAGFDDPNYFSRTFKMREGCSPVQHRAVSARLVSPGPLP